MKANPNKHLENKSISSSITELRRLIPDLPNHRLEALRRGLIDLLTDVNLEKARRRPDSATD